MNSHRPDVLLGGQVFSFDTVVLLFTGTESSAKLSLEHPETWGSARAWHHDILHLAMHANNSPSFQIIGDSFSAAIHRGRGQTIPSRKEEPI